MVDGQSGIPRGKGEKATPPNVRATGAAPALVWKQQQAAFASWLRDKRAAQGQTDRVGGGGWDREGTPCPLGSLFHFAAKIQ